MVDAVTQFLSILTVLANISTGILLFTLFFYFLKKKKVSGLPKKILDMGNKWAIPVSCLVALVSMTGSLFFSEVAGYEPCVLCWYQRIAMYPLTALFVVALIKKESKYIFYYVMPLVIIGLAIAGIHTAEQNTPDPFLPCSAIGYAVSCTKFFFRTFGYITIPVMSLSAFSFIFTLLLAKHTSAK